MTTAHDVTDGVQRLLLVEDNPGDAALVRAYLRARPVQWDVAHVECLDEALQHLSLETFRLVVADLGLPDADGLDAVEAIRRIAPATPLIVMSGQQDRQVAVEALHRGAQDFLVKGEADRNALERAITYAVARKENELLLSDRAMKDPLTGLANRAAFDARLAQDIARARRCGERVSVINADLDRFKPINDDHGHAAGDHVLRVVAERLLEGTREYDLVARLGGDEFAILISGPFDHRLPYTLAERLVRSVTMPIELEDGTEVSVSASCGIATFPESTESTTDLVIAADKAMYEAKRSGRNCVVEFAERDRSAQRSARSLESLVQDVVAREQLTTHFQPQVEIASGRVSGFEALLRWPPDPSLEGVHVRDFIRLLEHTGAIVPAGQQVLRTACRALAEWRARHEGLRVAVNVSSRELEWNRYAAFVEASLVEAGVPPSALEIEVPAVTLDLEAPEIDASLGALCEMGVRVVVDHFGSDVSSIAGLARHRVAGIKLGRRYTSQTSPGQVMLIGALHAMADHLGLDVIAFGIETEAEAKRVALQGCKLAQGYLYAGPVDPLAAEHMLDASPWSHG